jgi:hypothetical protein
VEPQASANAANQNYYVAPVFYEWNVFDLFGRKVEAVLRSMSRSDDEFVVVDGGGERHRWRIRPL